MIIRQNTLCQFSDDDTCEKGFPTFALVTSIEPDINPAG